MRKALDYLHNSIIAHFVGLITSLMCVIYWIFFQGSSFEMDISFCALTLIGFVYAIFVVYPRKEKLSEK